MEYSSCDGCPFNSAFEIAAKFGEQLENVIHLAKSLVDPAVEIITLIESDETGTAPQIQGEIMDLTAQTVGPAQNAEDSGLDELKNVLNEPCNDIEKLLCESRCPKIEKVAPLMLKLTANFAK